VGDTDGATRTCLDDEPQVVGQALSTLSKGMGPALIGKAERLGVELPASVANGDKATLTPDLVVPFLRRWPGHFFPPLASDAKDLV
jgi:hypothetical protein